jgi:2,4-dienoyl-CoA reductase-like NADH-dependent reductase (Old Yellow Enzyme family)
MDLHDLEMMGQQFVDAAKIVVQAGGDAVELHMGHGYVLSQFLCPHTNRRADQYGGSLMNRLRFPVQVLRLVRKAIDLPIIVKFNLCDGFKGGLEVEDAVQCAMAFEAAGADALVPSVGFVSRNGFFMLRGDVPHRALALAMPTWTKRLATLVCGPFFVPQVHYEEAFLRQGARNIKQAVQIPVGLLGGVTSYESAQRALAEGFAFVQMARALIRRPDLVAAMQAYYDHPDSKQSERLQQKEKPEALDVVCTHCNECVIATIDSTRSSTCVLRDENEQLLTLF